MNNFKKLSLAALALALVAAPSFADCIDDSGASIACPEGVADGTRVTTIDFSDDEADTIHVPVREINFSDDEGTTIVVTPEQARRAEARRRRNRRQRAAERREEARREQMRQQAPTMPVLRTDEHGQVVAEHLFYDGPIVQMYEIWYRTGSMRIEGRPNPEFTLETQQLLEAPSVTAPNHGDTTILGVD